VQRIPTAHPSKQRGPFGQLKNYLPRLDRNIMYQEKLGEHIEKFLLKHQDNGLINNHDVFLEFYMNECLNHCKVPTWDEWAELKRLYEDQVGVQLTLS